MGKSPAKWIKTILFRKKSSKSQHTKGRGKSGHEKELLDSAKARDADLGSAEPVISHPTLNAIVRTERSLDVENKENSNLPYDGRLVSTENQNSNVQGSVPRDAPRNPETQILEEAAMMVQAAFRGYLARRAFRALKGIIRLQALIRGHLVRRQAVATLRSMLGIVKLQAIARGRKARSSEIAHDVYHQKISLMKLLESKQADVTRVTMTVQIAKLTSSTYVHKLVASSPAFMPLRICYDPVEPNSVPNWLERWSVSCFWKPAPQPKRIRHSKAPKKHATGQVVEAEVSRPKRSVRRLPSANVDNNSVHTSEPEKPKRSFRKVSAHINETVQGNPEHELEKVKRSLRKVHTPTPEISVQQPEVETEKPKQNLEKVPSIISNNVLMLESSNSSEKMNTETPLMAPKVHDSVEAETVSMPSEVPELAHVTLEINEASQVVQDDLEVVEPKPLLVDNDNSENNANTNGELCSKEELTSNGGHKSGRKTLGPVKQERLDNGSPTVPSYMAATESAKAKLRAQGSPRFSQESSEKANPSRRHSLPSSTNGKVVSQSSRTQKAGSGGKSGNKSDKSLLSSRDGNAKGIPVEWRR